MDAALHEFNLAPLESRRDMAMLGLIHRTLLGQGPPQFQQWFQVDTQELRFSRRQVFRVAVDAVGVKICLVGFISEIMYH